MAYFTEDYEQFFKELAANNHKEWFDQNRKRYEQSVKKPFYAFTEAVIEAMLGKNSPIAPKDAVFRINRDIRFSKDKTPYKTQMSAIVSSGGKKDKTSPGLYYEIGPEHLRIYSGAHMLEKDQLQNVRNYIMNNMKSFEKIINNKDFKDTFGEIRGEKNKRLAPEFMEAANEQPLIFNKSFYYFAQLDESLITKDQLLDEIMKAYNKSKPVGDFFAEALKS